MTEITKFYKLQKQKVENGKLIWDYILSVHSNKDLLMAQMKDLQHREVDPTIFYSVVWYQSVDISHLLQPL